MWPRTRYYFHDCLCVIFFCKINVKKIYEGGDEKQEYLLVWPKGAHSNYIEKNNAIMTLRGEGV